MPLPPTRPVPQPPGLTRRGPLLRGNGREKGQGLVEFALILTPLLMLLLGIVQFGFVFNAYITVSTAAREGARSGTIYVYDRTKTVSENDRLRNNSIQAQLLASLNGLSKTAPRMTNGTTWSTSTVGGVTTCTNGDIIVTYTQGTATANDPRVGYLVTVKATYHEDLVIPLIGRLLPHDSGGRLPLAGEVTMVVN
jgi:Flp pilus assembly protein TadG